jgi:predicted transcriptional regulator
MKNRSRDMILSQILDVCTGRCVSKTRIVYQADLNFGAVNHYIELLTNNGLINTKTDSKPVVYETTSKGLALLHSYKKIQDELSL